jgi:hypothetical protein
VKLDNQTPFQARLLRVQRAEDAPVDGALVLKATFEQDAKRRWVPTAEQLPIMNEPLPTAFGVFHGETFMRKDGVDVGVLGTVRLARPLRSAEVTVSIGSKKSTLIVYGDRRWVRSGTGLVASRPEPFQEMPLSYERAYGGKTIHDYEERTWMDNPVGRGYYLSEEGAEGKPLANIESAAARPVRLWSDQAPVAGWGPYPFFWGLRACEAIKPSEPVDEPGLPNISTRINNNAHPDLVVPVLPQDADIRISGLRSDATTYTVPRLGLRLEVKTGDAVIAEPPIEIDGVFVWADLGHVTVTARARFQYPYNRGEIRSARLSPGA